MKGTPLGSCSARRSFKGFDDAMSAQVRSKKMVRRVHVLEDGHERHLERVHASRLQEGAIVEPQLFEHQLPTKTTSTNCTDSNPTSIRYRLGLFQLQWLRDGPCDASSRLRHHRSGQRHHEPPSCGPPHAHSRPPRHRATHWTPRPKTGHDGSKHHHACKRHTGYGRQRRVACSRSMRTRGGWMMRTHGCLGLEETKY